MIEFPFTAAEWDRFSESTRAVVNATLADDDVLCACHFQELRAVLAALREHYGDHPILLETEADFLDDPHQQCRLYRQAIRMAVENRLPTFSIRLSLARVLLDDFEDHAAANSQLAACEPELKANDDRDQQEWLELTERCQVMFDDYANAIRESLDDLQRGEQGIPLDEAFAKLRAKYRIEEE